MSKPLLSKKAATAALLGEPVDSAASEPKKKKAAIKKEDGSAGGASSASLPLDKQLVKLLATAPQGMTSDAVCAALGVVPSDLLEHINELLSRVSVASYTARDRFARASRC
jgi:hypothetical protein